MKRYIHGFWMCQSMFCAFPCPVHVWDEDARDHMLLFLPVIGLEIGLVWAGIGLICQKLGLPQLIQGFLLSAFPFWATGCIHLDGFLDVTDAVKSCRDLSRRREILKDSHVGAFAVIGCILLMMGQFAFCASVKDGFWSLMPIPVVSRCCSALAIGLLKPMSTSQYSRRKASKGYVATLICILILTVASACFFLGKYAVGVFGTLVGCFMALRRGYRSLEGMNGDISGYALTVGELTGVACLALGGILWF